MLLDIDTHSGVPIFRQLIDQIRRQIMTGQLTSQTQLPSVRDLAEQLRVNPMTVSKAYSLLESQGLLERKRGVGLFIAPGNSHNERLKQQLLDDLIHKTALLAVQLDIPQQDVLNAFQKQFQKLSSAKRRSS